MAGIMERLLLEVSEEGRRDQITLNTWFDRVMKALTVWLPLLVSGTLFLCELTGEFQNVFCYPPTNLTIPQANYLNAVCKETLPKDRILYSLFPYTVPVIALSMYLPHFLWQVSVGAKMKSQITFISNQIETVYSMILKLKDLKTSGYEVDSENALYAAQREMKDSVETLLNFAEDLISDQDLSTKLRTRQILKLVSLGVFDVGWAVYLGWFASGFQKDDSFVCKAKVFSSNNETEADEHISSTCNVIGVKHLYHVSFLLVSSFCFAPILFGIFVFKTYWKRYTFLFDLLQNLDRLSKKVATGIEDPENVFNTQFGAFSDFSILGRLCGENRHLIPNFNMIMHKGRAPENEQALQSGTGDTQPSTDNTPPGTGDRQPSTDGTQGRLLPNGRGDEAGSPSSSFRAEDEDAENLPGDGTPLTPLQGKPNLDIDENDDQSVGGPETTSIGDVEPVIHRQPSSGGSSSSKQSFHTEDETIQEGAAGHASAPQSPVHRRHGKNMPD